MPERMMTRAIPLTQGKLAFVDARDYEQLNRHKWYANNQRGHWYARRAVTAEGKVRIITMHRILLGASPGIQIDHRNGDGLDNRRANLRVCTNGQNQMNSKKHTGCSSRYKGVVWHKATKKWRAQIGFEGHKQHLGLFTHEEEAARAYDEAAKHCFGSFARLNFPGGIQDD